MENIKEELGNRITVFIEKRFKEVKIIEKISLIIFVIGFILFLIKQPNANLILTIGSILTGIIYFLLAFKTIEIENIEITGILNSAGFINFMYKLNYISLSVSYIAMLGFIIEFKNNNPMLDIGGLTLIIVLILSLITKINDRRKIYNFSFYSRIIVCVLLLSYFELMEYNLVK